MPTTFAPNFKNRLLAALTGVSATSTPLAFMAFFTGSQPADPTVSSGTAVFAAPSSGIALASNMSAAGSGVSQLTSARSANAGATASPVGYARLFDGSSVALVDADAGTSGTSIIIPSTSATNGVPFVVTGHALRMPATLGTVLLGASLRNRIVDWWTGVSTVAPSFGINTGGASTINVYTGAPPATADEPATGTLVATVTIGATNVFAAASGGSAALIGPLTVTANGTGTASYFRWTKVQGASTFTIQGSVGTTSADMIVNTVALTDGVTSFSVTDATLTF
jgi:hypothetical protein